MVITAPATGQAMITGGERGHVVSTVTKKVLQDDVRSISHMNTNKEAGVWSGLGKMTTGNDHYVCIGRLVYIHKRKKAKEKKKKKRKIYIYLYIHLTYSFLVKEEIKILFK